ncbi:MAG: 23S rRNA (pseudouridine(1915)-N(3))-methyltransferase RlmH, partial [Thermoplasmata archaeon]|nr:23S rRNA (pseudouridine(1915)-N(3))-methyltransferase RlmH [Thermoplasmata archaeon]
NLLKKLQMTKRNVCFIIGGWEGMDDVLKRKADYLLSLSKMTFPYQLVRIIFLEQLYRAFTIIKGINYHK